MLHREEPDGLVVITQPAHAWVSAQLARAWGNDQFGAVVPWEEVCLGAEQHDIGWTAWEAAPTLNPATGRPHRFLQLPRQTHLAIWSSAAALASTQSRYAALLVSLHGAGLYERHDATNDAPEDVRAVRAFLDDAHAFQEATLATLRADPHYAPYATPAIMARNRRLVGVWDHLSLALCMGLRHERTVGNVPTAGGVTTLTLAPIDGDPTRVTVTPWPFRQASVTLTGEGRRLPETFTDEATMRAALARAPWVTLTMRLSPVGDER
jgi:hypothetical protein